MELLLEKRKIVFAYALLAPLLLMVLVIAVYPLVYALVLSLTDRELFSTGFDFIGLSNYAYLFSDPEFWGALWNTVVYAGSCTIIQIIAGLGTAMLLVEKFRGMLCSAPP